VGIVKVLYVAQNAEEVRNAALAVTALGHSVMAADEQEDIRFALVNWVFDAVVVEKPAVLNPYREIITHRGLPVVDLKSLAVGKIPQNFF
jgi:hypothetical protein